MISFNDKKTVLGILLVLTILTIIFLVFINHKKRYNSLIIEKDKWNLIQEEREEITKLELEKIEMNDYNLFLDNENSTIYYSVVNSTYKYNPSILWKANQKVKLSFNEEITDEKLDEVDDLKIMIYNDKEYRIYSLIVTNYPLLNINYDEEEITNKKLSMEFELFDNHVESKQRVFKSNGFIKVIEKNREYALSLTKESLGNNQRNNYISIFGFGKRDEYLIKKTDTNEKKERYVYFFINNKVSGIYSFGPKDEKKMDLFKRNRENNK